VKGSLTFGVKPAYQSKPTTIRQDLVQDIGGGQQAKDRCLGARKDSAVVGALLLEEAGRGLSNSTERRGEW